MGKKLLLLSIIFCTLLGIIGCNKALKSQNENGVEKITMLKSNIPYSIKENMSVAIKKNLIQKQYGEAALIGSTETNHYEIRNISDGSKLIVIYDNATNVITDIWQIKKLFTHEDFKPIEEGLSASTEILKIDPYTNIIQKDQNNAISEHKLINNEAVVIDYIKKNNSWIVKKINYINPDPSNFMNIIKEEDLLSLK